MEQNKSTDKQRQNKGWENIEPYKFKPGESGNPNGRPKKADCLTSLLKEEIEKLCPFKKTEQIKKYGRQLTWKEMIVISTLSLAVKGVPVAFKEVWGRVDGKVAQPSDGDEEQPITINLVPATKGRIREDSN